MQSSTIWLGCDNGGSAQSSQRCGRCPASIFVRFHQDAGTECILKKMCAAHFCDLVRALAKLENAASKPSIYFLSLLVEAHDRARPKSPDNNCQQLTLQLIKAIPTHAF
jgi:hypothetical protein